MSLYASVPNWMQDVLDHFQTQEMCAKAGHKDPYLLQFVTNCFKTEEMCAKAVHKEPYLLHFSLIILRHSRCVLKQYLKTLTSCNLFQVL